MQQTDRYHRQTLLPQIGPDGQLRLAASTVLLVGCGALGSVLAEQLARAGVGHLRIVDRDIVELTNLQRQVLFDEQDALKQTPKAIAAARRLRQVNSSVAIEPLVVDLHAGNVEGLAGVGEHSRRVDLILDGADSAETRYLLNDVAVKHGIPWIYGACVGMSGRMMAILPGHTPCLRCLFPTPAGPGELATCDTVGVFSPVSAIVASLQAAAALKLLAGRRELVKTELNVIDLSDGGIRAISAVDARREDCIACGRRRFEFLDQIIDGAAVSLCGRNAVQVRPASKSANIDLSSLAEKLSGVGVVERTPFLLRCTLNMPGDLLLTVFPDGRLIIRGMADPESARSLYARFIGS
ncbi:MAG TPA: ThiF family adenylyltransferase [Tepidisphaeraceae bacterium]|jgi:adenylyltransferase/sulfurtransferase|nr:ThiF family adenylyltransferase [Tepidisphaeraceae bacterium]